MLISHCCDITMENNMIVMTPGIILLLYEEIMDVASSDSCSSATKERNHTDMYACIVSMLVSV